MSRRIRVTRTSTIVHWSGKDLVEMRRQLVERHAERKAAQLANMNSAVAQLHTPVIAGALLAVYAIALIGAMATSATWLSTVILVMTVGVACVDWWDLSTFHGAVNWALLKFDHPRLYWWAVIGAVLFFMVPGLAFFVQALTTSGQVREAQRQKLQTHIAELECEVLPAPAQSPKSDA